MTQTVETGLYAHILGMAGLILGLAACAPVAPTRADGGPHGGQVVCALPDCTEAQLRRALYGRAPARWPAGGDVSLFVGSGHHHGDTSWGLALGF